MKTLVEKDTDCIRGEERLAVQMLYNQFNRANTEHLRLCVSVRVCSVNIYDHASDIYFYF